MMNRGLIMAIALGACAGSDDVQRESAETDPTPAVGEESSAVLAEPCATTAPDDATATAMAKACDRVVEIEAERDEYSEVYVDPAGSRTLVAAIVPQRARHPDGTWGPLDATLRRVGELLAPTATVADVRFSTGGTGPFVTVTTQGHTFTMSWPAKLPEPTVAGDRAIYANVLPGVDLVVAATTTGFAHGLVVKTAEAAADPRVRHAHYRIGGDAPLTVTPEGGLFAEIDGVRVVSADVPIMWDSIGAARLGAAADTLGAEAKIARVGTAISGTDLVLSPDAAMLDDAGARLPLVIDPIFQTGQNQWAYATVLNENGTTTDNRIAPGDPSPAAAELPVGNDPSNAHQYRSFLRFPIAALAGRQILTAQITGKVDHTYLCGSNRPTYFYRSAAIAASPRQAWPGPALQKALGNSNVHANESSCGEPNMPFEVTSATLVSDVQASANARTASYYVALSAGENTAGANETNQERWMRYFLADFRLHITYNTKPNKPDQLTVDGKACVAGASRPFVKTTTPILRAHVVDPDGDAMNVAFTWARWNGSAWVDQPGHGQQTHVPNNTVAQFTATGNVDGGIYTFRSQSNDTRLTSDVTAMPGNCEWQVDVTKPAVPTVVSDIYLEGPTACSGGACGSVGQTGTFTFSSSSDTKSFVWGWSDPPTTPLAPATLGGSVSIKFTPTSSGPRTLYVRAVDRAGNENTRVYQFYVAAESTPLARWLLNDAPGAAQLGDDTGNGTGAAIASGVLGAPGRIVPGEDGLSRSALELDGTPGGGAFTPGPVIADTSKSFSVAAWVKLTDNTVSHRAVEEVGASASAFVLEYDKPSNAWKLTAPSADGATVPGATSTSTPRLGAWTHLAGTYDSASKELKLFVNGVLEKTTPAVTTWSATGSMRIGYSWAGSLSEVQAWNRVISAAEVFNLVDPLQVGKVGEWHMDEVGPGPAFDASGMLHDLTFFNGAAIPPGGSGQSGTGLLLDGVDDFAATSVQVLHTDQSFTVSVWARPATTAVDQCFVAQQSTGSHAGFSLGFSPSGTGVWRFRMHASSTDAGTGTIAAAPATGVDTAFHHLVGVFDAQKAELRLYVDGALRATTPLVAPWQPWDSAGPLLIGRQQDATASTELTSGSLDEVRVYQGVVANITRIP